jgi:hypothetical protein
MSPWHLYWFGVELCLQAWEEAYQQVALEVMDALQP